MLFLLKVPFDRFAVAFLIATLFNLLGGPAWAADRAYYSTGDSIGVRSGGSRVQVSAQLQAAGITARIQPPVLVSLSLFGPAATVRLPLSGVAPAGYRAGVLVTTNNATALLNTRLLETATLSTYLHNTLRETQPVDAALLKLALLAATGQPRQLEFTTSLSFDRVEVSFDPGASSGWS